MVCRIPYTRDGLTDDAFLRGAMGILSYFYEHRAMFALSTLTMNRNANAYHNSMPMASTDTDRI